MAGKKKSGRGKRLNGATPEGFREVEPAHLAGFWKPKKEGDHVRGIVGEMRRGKGADGNTNTYFQLDLTADDCGPIFEKDDNDKLRRVEVGAGMMIGVSGWAMVVGFMRRNEGKEIKLVFDGYGEASSGKNAPLQFKMYERDE